MATSPRRFLAGACTLVALALVLPAVALAARRVIHGPAGGGSGTVDITLVTKGRAVVKVTRFEFNNILVTCSIGRQTTSAASDTFPHTIRVDSKGNFRATVKANRGLATYSVRGHFKSPNRATGTLRIKGTVPACSGADSGTVRWSAKHN